MKKQSGLLRRLTALALTLCMLAALTAEIFAADTVASGKCGANGSNLTWTLDSEGTLTISGKGAMKDYDYKNKAPWKQYASSLKNLVLKEGITTIGDEAFSGCSFEGELDIPLSVTTIEDSAFRFCPGFTGELVIPDSVTSLGDFVFDSCAGFTGTLKISNKITKIPDNAFAYCESITNISFPTGLKEIGWGSFQSCKSLAEKMVIPDGVLKIGAHAFFWSSIKEIYIPASVAVIESYINTHEAFEGVMLERIEVDRNNPSYCVDEYGVLYNKDKSILYRHPINQNVMYRIPDSVQLIAEGAFSNCESLRSVIIPSSVTEIEDFAFTGCHNLCRVEIPASVKDFGAGVFYNCQRLQGVYFCGNEPNVILWPDIYMYLTDTPVYYCPETTGWIDSEAYDAETGIWYAYPLKTWDGKTILGETEIFAPIDKYCIRVIDEFGVPISGANVRWDGMTASTGQDGSVFFDLITAATPAVHVSKQGYLSWTNKNSNWQKSSTRFEYITLYPESYGGLKLKSAKIGRRDLLTETKVLNLRNDGALIGDLNSGYFDLSCTATDTSDVTSYAVYQNKKEIAKSTDGNFQKIDVRDFVEGGGCFVRVNGANGQTMDTRINLQFAKNSVNEDFKFQLKGKKISVEVSDEVPYLGGTSHTFELPIDVPIFVSATQDKIMLGINLKRTEEKNEDGTIKTDEEKLEKYKKTITDAVAYGKALKAKDVATLKALAAEHNKADFFKKCDVTYCGYAEADIGSKMATGYALVFVDIKAVNYAYNFFFFVPLTVQIGVKLSAEIGDKISYRFDTNTWDGNFAVDAAIALSPFVGLGASELAGLGAYGDAELKAKWNVFGTNSGLQTADLTGELGVKFYLGPWEKKKAFAHQTWHLYTADSVKSNSLSSGDTAWNADLTASDFTPSDLSYLAAESDWAPAAVQTYAAARAAQLKASYQPLLRGTYRNAQPVMVSDGSALYAAFVRADPKTGARYIALTKFDGNSWSEPVRVDASVILDDAPQLCTDGQTLWLAYARTTQEPGNSLVSYAQHQNIVVGTVNKDTLAFTEQKTYQSDNYMRLPTLSCVNGTPVLAWAESAVTDQESVVNPAASTVYTAEFRSGAWPDARKAADTAGVDSFCIGAQNGTAAIAYISDGTLYCGGRVLAENVTGRAVYGRLPGTTADSFIWNADGALHDEAGNTVPVEGLGRDFVIVGDSIYFNQSNGANANLAALHYDAVNDHWSAPILLIGDKQYLENLNAAELNGKIYALGMHTTVTITADDVDDAKDLVWTQILPVSDLKLSDVSFDADALVPGETLPVTFTVTNSGDHTVKNLTLTANGADTEQDCNLLPGESAEFTVNITCPSEKQTVTFEVQEPGQDDYTPEDNTAACTVGSADAEVELALLQIGSRKFLQAVVVNRGLEPASGSVLFTGLDGQVLAERTFQNLTYGGTVIAEYEPDSFAALYGEDVTATVRLQQDEPNMLNNTDSVPVLLTSTEILSAQRTGTAVTAEIACMQDGARAICAFYAADGRLLSTSIQTLQSGQTNSLSFTISDPNAAYAKLFVLDAKSAPAAAGKTVQLNG